MGTLPAMAATGFTPIERRMVRLASQGEKILAFRADAYYWRDLGRPADLTQAAFDFEQKTLWGSERNLP